MMKGRFWKEVIRKHFDKGLFATGCTHLYYTWGEGKAFWFKGGFNRKGKVILGLDIRVTRTSIESWIVQENLNSSRIIQTGLNSRKLASITMNWLQ